MLYSSKNKREKLPNATAWPQDSLTDEAFAQWIETHSLEKLIGTAEPTLKKAPPGIRVRKAGEKGAAFERLLSALRFPQKDLQAARRIARDKDISDLELLRSWIRDGLEREQRRAG